MRERIWAELQDKKFQEIYTDKLSKRAHNLGNAYSLFLVFASSGSVAAWTIWDSVPGVWGTIVALSQFLHLAKPFVPWIKNEREYADLSILYGDIYLEYEELWCASERQEFSEDKVVEKYHLLRKKDQDIIRRTGAIYCPESNKLSKICSELTEQYLRRHN